MSLLQCHRWSAVEQLTFWKLRGRIKTVRRLSVCSKSVHWVNTAYESFRHWYVTLRMSSYKYLTVVVASRLLLVSFSSHNLSRQTNWTNNRCVRLIYVNCCRWSSTSLVDSETFTCSCRAKLLYRHETDDIGRKSCSLLTLCTTCLWSKQGLCYIPGANWIFLTYPLQSLTLKLL